MVFCFKEKIGFARCSRFFNSRPNSAPGLRDLLVSVAARTALEVVQPIPRKNQVRVRIDKSGKDDFSISIDDFRAICFLLDVSARGNDVDLAVADQHSAIVNDPELR